MNMMDNHKSPDCILTSLGPDWAMFDVISLLQCGKIISRQFGGHQAFTFKFIKNFIVSWSSFFSLILLVKYLNLYHGLVFSL